MKNKENLNRYLSNLGILITKTHNLHWNVVGARFKAIHDYTEALYDYYFEKFDEVAETFKMKGEFPLVKVADYLKYATVKELEAKDFTIPEVVASIKEDMELMLADAKKIREIANEEDDFLVVSMMEDQIAYFVKQLWFISAMAK
ncbi:DNA starvation/stationary phase protection protein [Fusobacterium nucleatum]|uniref:Dps family protein n=1 Tax=Fusobacterium nucleatum TaxID=851 RepID=UPI0030CE8B1B